MHDVREMSGRVEPVAGERSFTLRRFADGRYDLEAPITRDDTQGERYWDISLGMDKDQLVELYNLIGDAIKFSFLGKQEGYVCLPLTAETEQEIASD
jgi:hypothetical protein